jgi:hypothetical protein
MITLTNIEGDNYSPNLDNYLVLATNDYLNTALGEIETLVKCIKASHKELVIIECEAYGHDLIQFLENIGVIVIYKSEQRGLTHYITVQKSVI